MGAFIFSKLTYRCLYGLFATIVLVVVAKPSIAQVPTGPVAATGCSAPAPQSLISQTQVAQTVTAGASPLRIVALTNRNGACSPLKFGLGDYLAVIVERVNSLESTEPTLLTHGTNAPGVQEPPIPNHYAVFLNRVEIDGLNDTYYDSNLHALVFHLVRNDKNASAWKTLLGAPDGLTRSISVALGEHSTSGEAVQPSIFGASESVSSFTFVVASPWRVCFAIATILAMFTLVWGGARYSTILKDNLVPQIDPKRQPYSLARWQMAVWFTLVFASYVVLYVILGDVNTLSTQALMLMGISGTTALAAVAVDAAKDTPDDAVNAGLRLLGINSYTDVLRVAAEIDSRKAQLQATPSPASPMVTQLTSEILDRKLLLRNYEDAIRGFVSEGWFRDIVTDINGTALHRLQMLCWTVLLGLIFLIGVWHDLAMPQFSDTLLTLMGVSGTGYVGFKYAETQH